VLGDPRAGGGDPGLDIPSGGSDLARDEREQALGIGFARDALQIEAEVAIERSQVLDHAVVREQAPVLLEGVRVLWRERAGGREADVCDERARGDLVRLVRERPVAVSGERLL
jgi:hypothetical protein